MTTKELVSLYRKTKNIKQVAKLSHHSQDVARRILTAAGVVVLPKRWKSKLSKQQIAKLYRKGHSISQIAKLNGTANAPVARVLKELQVEMRPPGGSSHHYKNGFGLRAKRLGMSKYRFVRLLAIRRQGGKCSSCGTTDLRVLDFNHINGDGVKRHASRKRVIGADLSLYLQILGGNPPPFLNVLCCNCNRLHEYERKYRKGIPPEFYQEPFDDSWVRPSPR